MNDQTYQKPTKVYKDQFYDLLIEIFHTTPNDDSNNTMKRFQTFVNRHNRTNKKPTFNAVIRHFNQNTNESDTTVMSNIIEIIANALPSFEDEWELLNVLRTYISIQRRKKVTTPQTAPVQNPYTPKKQTTVKNPYTKGTPALTKTVSEGTEDDDVLAYPGTDDVSKVMMGQHQVACPKLWSWGLQRR